MKPAPVFLLICDGWGHAPPSEGNAISRARTPIYDRWLAEFPWTLLEASGVRIPRFGPRMPPRSIDSI